ncbi:MAG TPA: hypothetical protein VK671_09015, partial [Mucilaginibacter sp.]|nr:hypothetical protein [Mucilaginibacter sp.]
MTVDTIHKISKKHLQLVFEEMKHHKVYYDDCVFVSKYSIKQRLLRYPYSKAAKIIAVSYPCFCNDVDAGITIDSVGRHVDTLSKKPNDTIFRNGLHVKKGVLNYSTIKEFKVLTQSQINQLTNIIYNTGFKVYSHWELEPALFENGGGGCFNPRNAILFIDKNGKIFDYLEVCFECQVADSESRKITLGAGCNQKFDLLKKYFISLGIKYGTINK